MVRIDSREKNFKAFIDIRDHGFVPDVITDDQYVFGAEKLPDEILRQDGQWEEFLPVDEFQQKRIETMACTSFGTLNCIEILLKHKYGITANYSERFTAKMSKTSSSGNSPHNVAETIRNQGNVDEEVWPYTEAITTWNQFYSPIPQNIIELASNWIIQHDFGHEWVFGGGIVPTTLKAKQKLIMEALKRSPLGISVCAWKYRNGKYWKDASDSDNHWCCLFGYKENDYWLIFDSYDKTVKKLEWSYNFSFCKKYYIKKRQKMLKRVIDSKISQEQYAIFGEEKHRIPDEATLNLLMHLELVTPELFDIDLSKFTDGGEFPSVVVASKLKELLPLLEDAFKVGAKSATFQTGFTCGRVWDYISRFFNV